MDFHGAANVTFYDEEGREVHTAKGIRFKLDDRLPEWGAESTLPPQRDPPKWNCIILGPFPTHEGFEWLKPFPADQMEGTYYATLEFAQRILWYGRPYLQRKRMLGSKLRRRRSRRSKKPVYRRHRSRRSRRHKSRKSRKSRRSRRGRQVGS